MKSLPEHLGLPTKGVIKIDKKKLNEKLNVPKGVDLNTFLVEEYNELLFGKRKLADNKTQQEVNNMMLLGADAFERMGRGENLFQNAGKYETDISKLTGGLASNIDMGNIGISGTTGGITGTGATPSSSKLGTLASAIGNMSNANTEDSQIPKPMSDEDINKITSHINSVVEKVNKNIGTLGTGLNIQNTNISGGATVGDTQQTITTQTQNTVNVTGTGIQATQNPAVDLGINLSPGIDTTQQSTTTQQQNISTADVGTLLQQHAVTDQSGNVIIPKAVFELILSLINKIINQPIIINTVPSAPQQNITTQTPNTVNVTGTGTGIQTPVVDNLGINLTTGAGGNTSLTGTGLNIQNTSTTGGATGLTGILNQNITGTGGTPQQNINNITGINTTQLFGNTLGSGTTASTGMGLTGVLNQNTSTSGVTIGGASGVVGNQGIYATLGITPQTPNNKVYQVSGIIENTTGGNNMIFTTNNTTGNILTGGLTQTTPNITLGGQQTPQLNILGTTGLGGTITTQNNTLGGTIGLGGIQQQNTGLLNLGGVQQQNTGLLNLGGGVLQQQQNTGIGTINTGLNTLGVGLQGTTLGTGLGGTIGGLTGGTIGGLNTLNTGLGAQNNVLGGLGGTIGLGGIQQQNTGLLNLGGVQQQNTGLLNLGGGVLQQQQQQVDQNTIVGWVNHLASVTSFTKEDEIKIIAYLIQTGILNATNITAVANNINKINVLKQYQLIR